MNNTETKINVRNVKGEIIQTVLLSDYLEQSEFSDKAFVEALVLSGETVHSRHANPVFDHSISLA